MSPNRPGDATLSVTRAAAVLGVHPNTIRAWSDQGRLASYRINERGDRRYRRRDLEAFMAAGAQEGPGPNPFAREPGERLERTVRGHRELLEITEAILGTLEPGDVLDRIAEVLGGVVRYDHLTIEVLDPESGLLEPVIARGVEPDGLRPRRPEEAGLAGWVLEHAEARLVGDDEAASEADEATVDGSGGPTHELESAPDTLAGHPALTSLHGAGAQGHSRIVAPLRTGGRAKGVLTLVRCGARAFSPDEYELAQLFAAHASIALQNAAVHSAVSVRARTDGLTGLLNHATLMEWLGRAVEGRRPFSLVLLDLDDFRSVNNRFGHPAGNDFLREIARALQNAVRESDIAFRYGGDEFVLALPATATDGAVAVAERMRAGLLAASGPVTATASIGVATFPDDGVTADEILLAADRASFAAKRRGRDRIITAAEALGPGMALIVRPPSAIDRSTLEWPDADRAAGVAGSEGARGGLVHLDALDGAESSAASLGWPATDLSGTSPLARLTSAPRPPIGVDGRPQAGRRRFDARRGVRRVREAVEDLLLTP